MDPMTVIRQQTKTVASAAGGSATTYFDFKANSAHAYPDLSHCGQVEIEVEGDAVAGSPTTPTLDFTIQSSQDGVNWTDGTTFTQVTSGAVDQQKALIRAAAAFLGRYVRLKAVADTAAGTGTWVITARMVGVPN